MKAVGLCAVLVLAASAVLATPAHTQRDIGASLKWARNTAGWDRVARVASLPNHQLRASPTKGVCDSGGAQVSGYLDTAADKHFFFWFFEAKNKAAHGNAPLVVWLNGGPGCSSMVGALTELGPCLLAADGTHTDPNPYGWNQNANLLVIDQPVATGFSYGSMVNNSASAADDFVPLLLLFYKAYPEHYAGGLHVFGESFAGHYIPAIGSAIVDHNAKAAPAGSTEVDPAHLRIPLRSVGIGNGMIKPRTQFKYYSTMACRSTYPPVLSEQTCAEMDRNYTACAPAIDACYSDHSAKSCAAADTACVDGVEALYFEEGNNNPYDVRKQSEPSHCYAIVDTAGKYLNTPSVQRALNAVDTEFQMCSENVYKKFADDYDTLRDYSGDLATVLDHGIRVLTYAGDADWICNWYGVKAVMQELDWSGKAPFNAASDAQWSVAGKPAGELRAAHGLSFLRIFGAGHMVPMDQPQASLQMLDGWLAGKL
ncbi:hypothetical protein H4R21_000526 [Coemansia helicoidea]|uniref:Uncharacterized protein n=1 Tax=Coemansia helicoidea TaxID=1286919 RepID=A0ACC1LGY2_9FUNG|nr:hypothetical protein H4R21_000526 [Coemansia helicoidea]